MSFKIKALLYTDTWLGLPGEHQYWPSSVYVSSTNDNSASVQKKQNLAIRMGHFSPQAYLNKGEHLIEGFIPWHIMPKSIR